MVIENDFKICYNQRESANIQLKTKEEEVLSKDEEIKFLKDRIKNYEQLNDADKQLELFDKEIKNIREKLIEKTTEFLKFESHHNEILQNNKNKVKEINELQQYIIDENAKIKGIILDLISNYRKNNDVELNNILNYLVTNSNEFELKSSISNENINNNNNEEVANTSVDNKSTDSQNENQFVKKVINEFDKILTDEYKKVEKFYKRDNPKEMRKSSVQSGKRKSIGEKNYVEWKGKTGADNWRNSLRFKNEEDTSSKNNKVDINNLANLSKHKIRNSIKGGDQLAEFSNKSREELSKLTQENNHTDTNVFDFYGDKMNKSSSPVGKRVKKEEKMRE